MRRIFLPMLLIFAFVSASANAQSLCKNLPSVPWCQQNVASPLGVNLSPGSDFPFLNEMWNGNSGHWGFGSTGLNGALSDLSLDANGWPTSSYRGGSGTIYTDGLSFAVSTPNFVSAWTVFCIGTGSVGFQGSSGTQTVSCPSTGGAAFTGDSGLFKGTITNDDQRANGNHITAIALVPTTYAGQFASAGCLTNPNQAACINPDFIYAEAPFRVLRFMDYQYTNFNTQTTNWASRPLSSQPFFNYGNAQTYYNSQSIPWGLPVDLETTAANAISGCAWYNIPLEATDDYVTNHSAYTAANAICAFYEYFNEAWNNPSGGGGNLLDPIAAAAFPVTITGITLGNPTVISYSLPSGSGDYFAHGGNITTGGWRTATVEGIVTGPTQLNGNTYNVTASTNSGSTGTVTLSVDTTADTAWSSGGGVQINGSMFVGLSYYTKQAAHFMDLVHTQWGSKRGLVGVLGTWAAVQSTTDFELGGNATGLVNLWSGVATAYQHFDAVAFAPYFAENVPDAWSAGGAGLTSLFQEINSGGAIPQLTGANTTTNSGNNYTLTSSSACGNGAIPSTPSNGTITCLKINTSNTGNATLTVDGGTQYPFYKPVTATNTLTSYQISSGGLASGTSYCATFTSQTGAPTWASGTTYSANALVSGSDNNTYFSVAGSNIGNNPVGDAGVHWTPITPAWWLLSCDAISGGMISQAAGYVTAQLATLSNLSISLPLVCYESGQSIQSPGDTFTYYLMELASVDSRFFTTYQSYYSALYNAGMTGVCNHYNDYGWSIFGTWGYGPALYGASGVAAPTAKQQGLYNYIYSHPKASLPFLLKRDILPGHRNDNTPMWLDEVG